MKRARRLGLTGLAALGLSLPAKPAEAVTTLTVDLSTTLGPVTHAASGSLYGVTETLPADIMGLIAPLHPRMFNNPAADVQQPIGDAIVVAGRVAPTGAQVTIRLADWFTGFYTFTNMSDWFNKIGQTVSRRKAAALTNIYAYEIWNEPNGTWAATNPLSFNEFWMQTFAQLRQLDPTIKIIGPSTNVYDQTYISSLLSFCKTNNCLPDIVGWHELEGANLTGDIQNYRALEKTLGIGPLPISINEYSGPGHIDVEGQPGASAPLIAKFERLGVYSASISFWDVAHPGRLRQLARHEHDNQRRLVVLQVVRGHGRQHGVDHAADAQQRDRARRLRRPRLHRPVGERPLRGYERWHGANCREGLSGGAVLRLDGARRSRPHPVRKPDDRGQPRRTFCRAPTSPCRGDQITITVNGANGTDGVSACSIHVDRR